MKIVIFSDLHSNIYALDKLISVEGINAQYVCNGDLIGYLPFNNECIEKFQSLNHIWIRGNHEQMFINKIYDDKCSTLAKEFFIQSFKYYDEKHENILKKTLLSKDINGYMCQHTLYDRYWYQNSEYESLDLVGKFIIGHSHIQFQTKQDNFEIINTGSLGQNRVKLNKCDYIVIEHNELKMKSINIACEQIIQDMLNYKYNGNLVAYYKKLMQEDIKDEN